LGLLVWLQYSPGHALELPRLPEDPYVGDYQCIDCFTVFRHDGRVSERVSLTSGETAVNLVKCVRARVTGRSARSHFVMTVALAFSFPGCGSDHQAPSANREAPMVLRRGLGGEPGSLDPATAIDTFSMEVLVDLYEGLTSESPDGTVIPGVASSWIVDEAGLKYTFHIRADAKWSNGESVKAADFVTAWRRVVDPQTGSAVADNLRLITGAEAIIAAQKPATTLGATAVSDSELVVDLVKPAPYFPQLLTHSSTFPLFSAEASKSHGGKSWVSNGPYVLAQWSPGHELRLSKNASYWDRRNVHIDQVNFVPVSDENAELRQYRANQLDLTESVPPGSLAMIRESIPHELHIAPYLGTSYYAFNLRRGPFRGNLALRQALTMAIDRRAHLASLLQFGQQPAFGFVPTGIWNYHPQTWAWKDWPNGQRRAEAQRLYAQAGYSTANPLHLTLLFNSSATIKQLAIGIAAMWKEVLGVDTTLIDEEYRVFLSSRKDPTRWDIVRLGWTADYNDASNFLDTLRSDSPNNDAGYHRNTYDALVDQAAATTDAGARRALLEQAEALMLTDYPIIPLYVFSANRLVKPNVVGVVPNPLNRLHSKDLSVVPP
jgi:oligopeptide transport system substrate-binding protein